MYATFNYGLEIEMSLEQAQSMSHSGDCEPDVKFAIENGLAEQLKGKEDVIRKELGEYGAWDDEELEDDDMNIMRILWIAANNIVEEINS